MIDENELLDYDDWFRRDCPWAVDLEAIDLEKGTTASKAAKKIDVLIEHIYSGDPAMREWGLEGIAANLADIVRQLKGER